MLHYLLLLLILKPLIIAFVASGNLLHRLLGHTTSVELYSSLNSRYLLSYGSWTDEDVLKLWNKKTMLCEASFSLDRTVTVDNTSLQN